MPPFVCWQFLFVLVHTTDALQTKKIYTWSNATIKSKYITYAYTYIYMTIYRYVCNLYWYVLVWALASSLRKAFLAPSPLHPHPIPQWGSLFLWGLHRSPCNHTGACCCVLPYLLPACGYLCAVGNEAQCRLIRSRNYQHVRGPYQADFSSSWWLALISLASLMDLAFLEVYIPQKYTIGYFCKGRMALLWRHGSLMTHVRQHTAGFCMMV